MTDLYRYSTASNPGRLQVSGESLRRLSPELYAPRGTIEFQRVLALNAGSPSDHLREIRNHLAGGDCRAALVMQTSPLFVAAYTDELDCVVLLEFPDFLVEDYELSEGTRLLTVNMYFDRGSFGMASDLRAGPHDTKRFGNFRPFIAEFLSEDTEQIGLTKLNIPEEEWERTEALGRAALQDKKRKPRLGHPLYCRGTRKKVDRFLAKKKPAAQVDTYIQACFVLAIPLILGGVFFGKFGSKEVFPFLLIPGLLLVAIGHGLRFLARDPIA